MALLRPCGRFVQSFGKLPVSCQSECIREIVRGTRVTTQGYVTATQKAGNSMTSTEKLQVPSVNNNLNQTEVTAGNLTTNDLQRRLVSLCLGSKNGKIRNEHLIRILESYTVANDSMEKDSSGLLLLRNCGNTLSYVKPADRRILTSHVWKIICRRTSTLTLEHYNTLLKIHVENNEKVEPKMFLNDMTVNPNDSTYRLLLNAAAQYGDVESALYILSRMKSEGFSLNEQVFNLLILTHATNKDIKSVLSTLDTMINARIEPSVETYGYIACGYASVGDIGNTLKILNAHPLNVAQIMEIIKRLSDLNLGKYIGNVLKYLPSSVLPTEMIFLNTVTQLTYNGKPEDAFELMNRVTPAASSPDEIHPVFNGFLKDMIRAKIPNSTILKFMNTIMTEKNYPLAIMDVCEGALHSGDRELAMTVFEAMHERKIQVRPHYYWPLLVQASRIHGETDVFRTLRHMLCLNVSLDHDTLETYVLPYTNTIDPFVTLRKFGDLGLEYSVIFTPMICYYLYQGKIKEALALCSGIKAPPIDFEKVLDSLSVAYKITRNVNDLVKFFKFAPPDKFYPEAFLLIAFGKLPTGQDEQMLNEFLRAFKTAEIAVSDFTNVENQKDDNSNSQQVTIVNPLDAIWPPQRIPHPRDMNVEELECHLIELKAKGMNVRGVLRKLLQIHCRLNNKERVEAIKEEYEETGLLWTPGMYSSLLEFYTRNDKVDEAMNLYSQIQQFKNFNIDEFKIVHLATVLVNANRINDAFTVLVSTTSKGGSRISKDCWRLLDAVARSSNNELTESMLEILVTSGLCERSNIILGPLVRQHLVSNDLTSAVDTFVKCAQLYRHTPLRQELMTAILESIRTNTTKEMKNEMIELLERVQTFATMIRGSVNTKMDLLVSMARLQMTDKLRKFLQNNRVTDDALKRHLELVPEEHKLSTLTTILDASTGIPHINRSFIYEEILSVHSRSGDCEKVIELWKKLSEEETIVSRTFRIKLESLLKKNNVPLPEGFSETRFDK